MKGLGEFIQISMDMTILGQKKIEKAEFDKIMAEHKLWLADHEKGKRADFNGMDLSGMDLSGMDLSYADMTGAGVCEIDLNPENLKGVKGLYMPIFCPEEGSFTAWKKCRASEAVVLEIFDKDGTPVEDAASCHDKDFIYRKGETVYPKAADKEHMGDWDGIYFVLSRSETEFFRESEEDDQDDEN
ncbi:Pentapeptide repeat-containing protein [Lachnospiraceae bacterium KH1T2]|nr:Pentapeptide repeat-containing protein [Lachnospiraceae bacterium KH1T2]